MRFGKFRAGYSTLRWKVEVKQDPRGVPAGCRPQHERQKENEDADPFPLRTGGSTFTDRPQYFGTLRDPDKHGPGNQSDNEAETTWL